MGRFDLLTHCLRQLGKKPPNHIVRRESVGVLRFEILFTNNGNFWLGAASVSCSRIITPPVYRFGRVPPANFHFREAPPFATGWCVYAQYVSLSPRNLSRPGCLHRQRAGAIQKWQPGYG